MIRFNILLKLLGLLALCILMDQKYLPYRICSSCHAQLIIRHYVLDTESIKNWIPAFAGMAM